MEYLAAWPGRLDCGLTLGGLAVRNFDNGKIPGVSMGNELNPV
jgi:hypothetical protein